MFDDDGIQNLISRGVKQALEETRKEAKLGRSDTGRGSIELGNIVYRYRTRMKMTQKALADEAGLHPTTIGKIESGERGMSLHTFSRLSQVLSIDNEEFMWEVVDKVASWPST